MSLNRRGTPKRQKEQIRDAADIYTVNMRRSPGGEPYATDEFDLFEEILKEDDAANKRKDEEIHS